MAKNKRQQDLADRLHAHGLRKRLAAAIAGTRGGRRKNPRLAQDVLGHLEAAGDLIREDVLGAGRKRSEAAKKGARTRKRNAERRSAAAKRGRAKAKAKS